MSGICGLMRFDGRPVDAETLRLMLDGLRPWGEAGAPPLISPSGRAGLGVRVSRVTPEDDYDRQPLASRDGRLSLVADVRLDNRPELGAMLGLSSSEAAAMPDSAFILAAWDAWSEASVPRLVGDFAFLLWDEREQALWAARDHIGQRVLYYHSSPARMALASSPAALLALEDVHPRLNEQKLGELLVDIRDSETTCVEGILRLPPAHVMRVSPEGVTRHSYWSFEDCSQLTFRSGEECSDAFREALGRAVRDRLRSRQRVAVSLSAGLDSSSIAALAATTLAEHGGRLSAYHAAPAEGPLARPRDGWILDESDDVVSIARMHASVDLSILRGPWSMPLDEAVTIFPVLFAPVRNVLNVPWYLDIYRRARADGANVLLTGGWGNFTISASGDRWLHEIGRSGRLFQLIREVRAFASARQRSVWDVVKGEVLLPVIPHGPGALFNRLRGKSSRLPIWERTYSPIRAEFARALRLEESSVAHGYDSPTLDRQRLTEGRIAA
jgi:asparagine synthase (glutamine-hydrolysing)